MRQHNQKELRFRLWFSLAGLGLVVCAVFVRGVPQGPAFFEVIGVAGAFFGGTVLWTLRKMRQASAAQQASTKGE